MVQSMDKERSMGIIKHEKSKSDKKVFQYIEQLKNIDMNVNVNSICRFKIPEGNKASLILPITIVCYVDARIGAHKVKKKER